VVGIICCIVYNTSNTYKRQTTDYSHRQYDYKFDLDIVSYTRILKCPLTF
jgi:hypothetical protein